MLRACRTRQLRTAPVDLGQAINGSCETTQLTSSYVPSPPVMHSMAIRAGAGLMLSYVPSRCWQQHGVNNGNGSTCCC